MRATATVAEANLVPNNLTIMPITSEMVPAVSRIHFEAFTGYMNVRLGVSYVRKFIAWFIRHNDALALVATEKGRPIGYVLAAPRGYQKLLNRDLLLTAVLALGSRPWLFFSWGLWKIINAKLINMLVPSSGVIDSVTLPSPVMSLVAIGVSPLARGKSVGSFLLRDFEAKARALGIRALQLSVYSDNQAARHLYEKCGWQLCHTSKEPVRVLRYFRHLD